MAFFGALKVWISKLSLFLISIALFMPSPGHAADTEIERDLQEKLKRSKAAIQSIEEKLKAGSPVVDEINKLRGLTANIKSSHLLLQERFRLREQGIGVIGSKARERHRAMEEGYLKTLTDYLNLIESVQQSTQHSAISDQLQTPSESAQQSAVSSQLKTPQTQQTLQTLETLKTLLDRILPKKKRPIHGSLPYRNLNYPSREPNSSPPIRPAYKGGPAMAVTDEDTMDTEEAPISLEIAEFAQSLNWKPVAIYEYLKGNIETEWYWGCQKGAEETLRQKSGNDCDQATLFAALLRASGFPTRYVRGTIEFFAGGTDGVPMERARNLTGIDDPAKIAEFFRKAGIPYKPVIQGGKITNFHIEHIWVESRIPYGNYRGTMIDDSDPTWLGLDTSIKSKDYVYNAPRDILQVAPLAGLREIYLNAVRPETPLEFVKTSTEGFLAQQYPGVTYNDLLLTKTLVPHVLGILPASMQFEQRNITHEYTEIPEELKHKIKLSAFSSQRSANGDSLFEIIFDTMELSNRQIALSYEPETVEDQEIIDSYGGLDNTPAYLVRLRPMLKVDGEVVVAGKDGLPMGEDHDLTIELISPNGTERVTNTQITGNLVAIGITAQKAISDQQSAISTEDDDAETILFKEANRYTDRWNQAEYELASLLHLTVTRPIPTVVTVGGVIDVTYLLDMPHGFEWKGVFVDAGLRTINIVGAIHELPLQDDRQKTFMELSALQGSILENRIFEDDFQVDSISTAKLFQVVGANGGSPFLTIDKTNIDSLLPNLDLADNIKEDIMNSINQNFTVRMPSAEGLPLTPMSYRDWTGIGYTKEDLLTNESGYMLSGMIAGGMTAISPDKWPQDIAERLGKPYASEYKTFEITYPANESIVFNTPLTVKGIVLDPDAIVTVNGIGAEVGESTFTAAGIKLTPGINRITATYTNEKGITLTDSVTVKYKIILKTYITFPYDGTTLSVSPIDVEGIVSDPSGTININGINATVSPDGRFMAKGMILSEGANAITATATNSEGDTDTQTITVNYKANSSASPIQVYITSPANNETINRPSVLVKGTVATDAQEVWIKVNGVLAEVYNGQFVANHVPLVDGDNSIIVNTIDSNGGVGRAEVSVKANTTLPYITLDANITSGIPPLATYFQVNTEMPNPAVIYQIDFDGDGVADYTGATFEDISHTYTTEGIYYPTLTVTDDQGNAYTDVIGIVVMNRAQIDTLLKAKWEGMKTALGKGDIEGALQIFTSTSKERYRAGFTVLKEQLSTILNTFVDFSMVGINGTISEYELVTNEGGKLHSYPAFFLKNGSGIWKLNNF